ncbi:MAG: glycosyltransferase family 4 protein [Candidatus Omnitrophica bacterium]|nr:glycosyltransferase family 4 protein [Candidatus Omnitrophota bacterium]
MNIFVFAYWPQNYIDVKEIGLVRVWEISEGLCSLGNKVVVFVPKYRNSYAKVSFKIVEVPFLRIKFCHYMSFYLISFFMSVFYALRLRPDIVYLRQMDTFLSKVLAKCFGAALVLEVHHASCVYKTTNRIKDFISKTKERFNLALCDKIVSLTYELKETLKLLQKVPTSKIAVITSGSNISLFRPIEAEEARNKLGLKPDIYYVGFIGTLYEHQGIEVLVRAAPAILGKFSKAIFLIVGDGPVRGYLDKEVRYLGLSESFIFTGHISYYEMPSFISAMDVCVAPFLKSRGSASPVKIFDYFASGRPVVASDVECSHSLIANSKGGILVPPENPQALSQAIIDLLPDKEKRDTLGKNGREFVVNNYSWDILAKMTVRVCKEVLNNKSPV